MFIVNLAIFDTCMMLEMPLLLYNSAFQRVVGGTTWCTIYAILGSFSGIGGACTNAVIAYDRFKTISSPMDGKLNRGQAFFLILLTWLWTMPFTLLPAMKIWGRYIPEGWAQQIFRFHQLIIFFSSRFLTTCSFDYLTDDDDTRLFTIAIFTWAYLIPLIFITIFYFKLFGHIVAHQKMLKEQAKKMNVASLSNNSSAESMEIRIAKACFTIFFLYVCAWTRK